MDDVLNNAVNPETGRLITGTVAGSRGTAGLLLSPRFADYRLNLRINAQAIQTFSRAAARIDDFDDFTHLITASLDFDLGPRSVAGGPRRFRPSIGVTWTDGEDPLAGRKDQSTVTIGLRLAYN